MVKDEVLDKMAANCKRAGGKVIQQPVTVMDGPMIVAELQQNENWNLNEGEPIIAIRPVDRLPS